MSTHHAQITTAAKQHGWDIRESSPRWMELMRGRIYLNFAFRSDGRLSTGNREDKDARPGYSSTAIPGRAKNKLAHALAWITDPAPHAADAVIELDAPATEHHAESEQEPPAVDQADADADPTEPSVPRSDFEHTLASMIAAQIRLALTNTAALTTENPERPNDTVEHLTQAYRTLKHQYGLQ